MDRTCNEGKVSVHLRPESSRRQKGVGSIKNDVRVYGSASAVSNSVSRRCSIASSVSSLVQAQKGIVSRREATTSLVQLILDAKRDVHHRVEACFHVLYLQSAFPDVFDLVSPPFPIGDTSKVGNS